MGDALAGQVAIVTGAGRGIGRAIAQAFAAASAAVTVVARSADEVADTVAHIDAAGGRALALPADVTDRHAVEQLVAETVRRLGAVDVLVNNAGITGPLGPVWENDPDEWRRCMDINLYGTFLCAWAVLPGMVARRRGRIINMSSPTISSPVLYYSSYDSVKTAVIRFTATLARETREYGISVFTMFPGAVRTAMADGIIRSPWALKAEPGIANDAFWSTPPERPAELCLFLASWQADALTGRALHVRDDEHDLVRRAEEIQQHDRYTLQLRT